MSDEQLFLIDRMRPVKCQRTIYLKSGKGFMHVATTMLRLRMDARLPGRAWKRRGARN